jgi:hypothetical protein
MLPIRQGALTTPPSSKGSSLPGSQQVTGLTGTTGVTLTRTGTVPATATFSIVGGNDSAEAGVHHTASPVMSGTAVPTRISGHAHVEHNAQ